MNCTVIMKQTILAFSFILFTFYEILLRVVKVQEEADKPVNSLDSGRSFIRLLERQSACSGDKAHARDAKCQCSGGAALWRRKRSIERKGVRSGCKAHACDKKCPRSGGEALTRDAMWVPSRCHHRLSRCLHHCQPLVSYIITSEWSPSDNVFCVYSCIS